MNEDHHPVGRPLGESWPAHASPLPWTYHSAPDSKTFGRRDWIEDAHGSIVVEHVGHIDGPAICAAVNIARKAISGEKKP